MAIHESDAMEMPTGWVRNPAPLKPQQRDQQEPPERDAPWFCPQCSFPLDMCRCEQ